MGHIINKDYFIVGMNVLLYTKNTLCEFFILKQINILLQVVVYILDRLVWMLLITAFATQALQMAGIIDTPKGYQGITYSKVTYFSLLLTSVEDNYFIFSTEFVSSHEVYPKDPVRRVLVEFQKYCLENI